MKLIIAGGRDYRFTEEDRSFLDALPDISEIVSGRASGADAQGEEWAKTQGLPVAVFKADWKAYGRGAGPLRNIQMADYANALALFPGGCGTASMRYEAEKRGLEIFFSKELAA